MPLSSDPLWYKNAIFYELHIRAFADSNGDGKGDLSGIIPRLDYLQELGVNCLWLLPMFPSPLKDDGYDIADYYHIHPDYGTVEDFSKLLDAVHVRGIRVITDLVLNHTSDQHPWFRRMRHQFFCSGGIPATACFAACRSRRPRTVFMGKAFLAVRTSAPFQVGR